MSNKEDAQRLFNLIPYGHEEPLQRPSNSYTDRILRDMIETANKNGDCIINVGRGIYRPVPRNIVDDMEYKKYIDTELERAKSVLRKRTHMMRAYRRRAVDNIAIHTGNTGEIKQP